MTVTVTQRTVLLSDLQVEPLAQRDLNKRRMMRIADAWDVNLVGTIIVAIDKHTRVAYVVDGQHRKAAAEQVGETELPAVVHDNTDQAYRAKLFLGTNGPRKGPTPFETYEVSLTAGERWALDIRDTLDSHGLAVGKTPSTNRIAAITKLRKMHDDGGVWLISVTVEVLMDAFGGLYDGDEWQTDILYGVAVVVNRNSGLDRRRLARVLGGKAPRQWMTLVATASGGSGGSGGRPLHMARLLVDGYNKNLRTASKKINV